jgi:hypothetical protein
VNTVYRLLRWQKLGEAPEPEHSAKVGMYQEQRWRMTLGIERKIGW